MIEPGRQILHYRLIEQIGEGGMGVVWKAVDTTLDREVAIKVLPADFADDPERLLRFEREAKLLASLNHPNIAAIHSLHEAEGIRFLALELVDGEDLAQRLMRGPLPVDEAVERASQIAQALEIAHEQGVIHRDLKPANVKVSSDSTVKVLDFGLAKAMELGGHSGDSSTALPTVTSAGTVAGTLLGTAAYMSPEQARGQELDRRSDVWSFGCVLYELLVGKGPFRGETITDVLAAIVHTEPDWSALPPQTPSGVRDVLERCLRKDLRERLRDMGDVGLLLREAQAVEPVAAAPRRNGLAALLASAAVGLVAGALLWSMLGSDGTPIANNASNPVRRSSIAVPAGKPVHGENGLAISPDGSRIAIVAGTDETLIYLRPLDSLEMEPIPGTEDAWGLFFAPDGDAIGFFAEGELRIVSLRSGGEVTVLCDVQAGWRGTWDSSGWIYFNHGESRLARIRQEGGDVQELGEVGDVFHMQTLPDGRGILLTVHDADSPSTRKDTARIVVLSNEDLTVKTIFDGGYNARYLPSGHLTFMRAGALFAVRFDLERLEATPPAVNVLPQVRTSSIWGLALYDTASDGTLAYVSGGDLARTVPTWIDLESGEEEPMSIPPALYNAFDLSPDGTQLAIQNLGGSQDQVWIHDSRRDTFSRFTLEGANFFPVWSFDGRELFFASNRDGKSRLFRQPVDGSAAASRLLTEAQEELMETDLGWPSSVTPDGKYLVIYTWGHPERGGDLWKVPLDGSGDPEPLLATKANEIIPEVSPDGKWLAYLSNQRGTYDIVVRPFADMQDREWLASNGEGYDAIWSPGGDALLYWEGLATLMSVPVTSGDEFAVGAARELRAIEFHDASGPSMAISPDGKRLLVQKPVDGSPLDEIPITLVTGWADEVARLVESK